MQWFSNRDRLASITRVRLTEGSPLVRLLSFVSPARLSPLLLSLLYLHIKLTLRRAADKARKRKESARFPLFLTAFGIPLSWTLYLSNKVLPNISWPSASMACCFCKPESDSADLKGVSIDAQVSATTSFSNTKLHSQTVSLWPSPESDRSAENL